MSYFSICFLFLHVSAAFFATNTFAQSDAKPAIKSGVLLVVPTDRRHPDKNFRGAAVLDMGMVERESLDVELARAREVMPDPSRRINVAVYVAEDLPVAEQRELCSTTEAKFRTYFSNVRIFTRYVPRKKIELPADEYEETNEGNSSGAFVTAEIPTDDLPADDSMPRNELAGNPVENFLLTAGSVQASVRATGFVGIAKAAISFSYWLGRPGLGWYRLFLLATEPAIEIGYTVKQKPFSHWLRTHNIAFHRQLHQLSETLQEKKIALANVPSTLANNYRNAEIPKAWLLNVGIFFVLRPGWGKLVNHWADPQKPSPFGLQFLTEIGIAGVMGIFLYVMGDKGFENLRRAGIGTGAAHRNFLAATSFVSLVSLLLYTANPDPLSNVPLLTALAIEGASYLAVYGLSVMLAPVNNRFVIVDERLFAPAQVKTTRTVLDEMENLKEAVRTEEGRIEEIKGRPKLRRFADDKDVAHVVGRLLNRPYTCVAALMNRMRR